MSLYLKISLDRYVWRWGDGLLISASSNHKQDGTPPSFNFKIINSYPGLLNLADTLFAAIKEKDGLDPLEQREQQEAAANTATPFPVNIPGAIAGEALSNADRYLNRLAYLESTFNPRADNGVARGAFQFTPPTVTDARRAGIPDPTTGSMQEQASATWRFIQRYHPDAAQAIVEGDFAEADSLLNNRWVSLPGGSQSNQSAERIRQANSILRGDGLQFSVGTAGTTPINATSGAGSFRSATSPQLSTNTRSFLEAAAVGTPDDPYLLNTDRINKRLQDDEFLGRIDTLGLRDNLEKGDIKSLYTDLTGSSGIWGSTPWQTGGESWSIGEEEWFSGIDLSSFVGDQEQFAERYASAKNSIREEPRAASTSEIAEAAKAKATSKRSQAGSLQQTVYVEWGWNGKAIKKFSYICVGIEYSRYPEDVLVFNCAAGTVALNRETQNNSFHNSTTKKVFEKLLKDVGLTLNMQEDGAEYLYVAQRNQTGLEFIKAECARLGYLIKVEGRTVTISPRTPVDKNLTLENGVNVITFSVKHSAGEGEKGARTPDDNSETGKKVFDINPLSGLITKKTKQTQVADPKRGTPGTHNTSENTPLTTGSTTQADNARLNAEQRVKGILLSIESPMDAELLEKVILDGVLRTKGFGPLFFDKLWIIDAFTFEGQNSGFKIKVDAYTPLTDKSPEETSPAPNLADPFPTNIPDSIPANDIGFIWPERPVIVTSEFGMRNGRMHRGIDMDAGDNAPVFASAAGTVIDVVTGCQIGNGLCGGGFGNRVYLSHAGGFITRYAHLGEVNVTLGQRVQQGQRLGIQSNTGASRGSHLHFEILKDSVHQNPRRYLPNA